MLASIASDKPLLCWNRLHQKMNVILIRTNLQKLCLVALLYLRTNICLHAMRAAGRIFNVPVARILVVAPMNCLDLVAVPGAPRRYYLLMTRIWPRISPPVDRLVCTLA